MYFMGKLCAKVILNRVRALTKPASVGMANFSDATWQKSSFFHERAFNFWKMLYIYIWI